MSDRKNQKIEDLVSRGSTNTAIQFNGSVPSGQMWTREGGLEKVLDLKAGDAVTLVGKTMENNDENYFIHGSYSIIPISAKNSDVGAMAPGAAYISAMEGEKDPDNKELLGVINPQYLVGVDKNKIGRVYQNGLFLDAYPNVRYSSREEKSRNIIRNIGYGVVGKIPVRMTDEIADRYDFPRPKPGDTVLGIAYKKYPFDRYDKESPPGAFALLVSDEGDKLQIPYELKNPYAIEVVIGLSKKLGRSVV